ncbi:putative ABC transporter, AAA+ ATPase domain, P-loop containing nucleoside triphosphate hydrolase [Helianthus annuus]|uniref:Adenosinetriphosphatase n=1 Tax=Helianthus annuus TaxID=4232 RepID=A0A251TX96_HELAN|nr:ABC transporter F family member 5 [Helianthus annuus]KAF5791156.1 putative adenosinetriphosphatase [Helianthus annuus]KAJ0534668.1 putative ABC transporter, AAA+ ATPase domain, P-loop containing nucleoside triphosphate hydrolase [Helianthus annuus]KAJ0542663.1 putative ABC transporter, AAA+ ATPase domain, P-loop containing nucleoside triphosphate hydrolase [Helianthus annuus]KAJ0888548.1 putative ABC transporter, AAA+ ATPase domain, P-loop containing nucleoside triphosphate hydrolase [Helian
MELSQLTSQLHHIDLHSTFLTPTPLRKPYFRPQFRPISSPITNCSNKPSNKHSTHHPIRLSAVAVETETTTVTSIDEEDDDIESLFSSNSSSEPERRNKPSGTGASSISSGVRLENISKSYKGVTVLKDVSWEVKKGEKVGLVGVNGAGKTTQLRIISGLEEPDSGNVVKAKPNMRISFLSQEFEVSGGRTVREEFMCAFKEEMEVAKRLEKVQKAIEGSVDDLELMGRLLDEFDLLQRRAQAVDLDSVDVKISKLMPELGFSVEDGDRLVASFSGGWQMRMSLGKILLQDPDLLLLDEPTNHLDLDTIEWLEGYLSKQDVPMVIISHDRAFLDQLCTKIVETDMGVSRTFIGNYSDYIISKASWIEAQFTAWEKQQKEIEHTRGLISRLSAGANSGRASTAEKKLEKLQEEEQVDKPFIRKQMKIRFPERGRSGREVVTIKNLDFSYEDKVLFKKANIIIERGEKIAIIGPNGCGKSTLLKLIMGIQKPDSGEVILGEHNVLPNYFEQNQAEALDLEKTVLDTVAEVAEDWRIDDIKGLLGRCNFKADMLERKVSLLSGGEKARLAFCKFMVKPSTLLVLDEPTNHLDIPSKEMLEEAISEYEGTVITVSHDRYFIKQIVNRVLEVKDGNLQDYNGDYDYYLEKNLDAREKALEREAELEDKSSKAKAKSKMSKAEREARKKQKMQAFQQAKQKSKGLKNSKRWN